MKFSKDSIFRRKLEAISDAVLEDVLLMPDWQSRSAMFLGKDGYTGETEDGVFHVGDTWECRDDFTRWFTASVTVPESFAGKPLALNLEFGGEGIVRVNGKIASAITSYLEPRDATRTRVMLSESAKAGETYQVEIEAHLNYMEFNRFRRKGGVSIRYTIRTAALVTINRAVESYYFDIKTVLDGIHTLENPLEKVLKSGAQLPEEVVRFFESVSKEDFYADKLREAALSSITCVDFDFDRETMLASIPKAAETFRAAMKDISSSTHGVIKFVGQAHIDTAWLWPIRESIRKSAKTLSNVCALMDQYPEFTFAFSQPQLFEFVKENYPELYERVKEKVKSGQFELVGNTWVEMDANIPSGESLVRQILYGRQYFLEEFGKCSDVFWMPDVFGYTWALPQIIKRSGMKYFFTSKLINNDDNRFPHSLFQWQGIDGTRIPAYLQRLNYNGRVSPETLRTLYQRYDQKPILDEALMTFGYGDGGGGPTYQMLETAKRLEHYPGLPRMELSTSESFFKDAEKVQEKLPVWNDEMYYEFHRGTYTSQARTKKNNRKSELLYRRAEMASIFSLKETGAEYPYADLLKGYKALLTHQFHDIIPGSSIHSVYEDAQKNYSEILGNGAQIASAAQQALCGSIAHPANTVVVFNYLSWQRSEPVTVPLPEGMGSLSVRNDKGQEVPSRQYTEDGAQYLEFLAENVPPMGYASFVLVPGQAKEDARVSVSKTSMENGFYRVALDENGILTSVYDKLSEREVLAGPSNVLKIFEDKPGGETAWNIDIEYQNKEWSLEQAVSVEILEASPLKGALRVVRKFHNSTITQDIVLYADLDRIEFRTAVDWHEREKMLKAEFLPDILSSKATYEIQFGAIERPTHENTSYDRTKFEVCGHKWADLSEGDYGVSLLNDCKYGYDIKENRMRLTLLRSPIDPDLTADQGYHTFCYAIRPHKGGWTAAGTVQAGYALNVPLEAQFCPDAAEGSLPPEKSYFQVSKGNVILDTVKAAEDGDGIILRLYESSGTKTRVSLQSALPFAEALECNLVEENERPAETEGSAVNFEMHPFEIKTFRLR